MQIAEISTSYRKWGSRNTMVRLDFRLEVEIWLYHTCTMKNMQHNPYLMAESLKFLQEQFSHCGHGYEADTTFHRKYF